MSEEDKARQLMADAKKKLDSSKGFLGSLFGGGSKVEEASEMYHRAANMFKMSKNWSKAGDAFCEVANLSLKNQNRHDAATNFVDAANCYKKVAPTEAVTTLMKAIDIFTDMGRFTVAAKHHQTIAEIYETEKVDLEKCIKHYEKAADFFRGEESTSSANKCQLKVAQYAAEMKDYEKAISIYDQVAATSLESSLLKYSAKDYFFRALLCHLCIDVINANNALTRYQEMYPAFQDSRECKLIKSISTHLEEENVDAFTETVTEYDSISRLDQWTTMMLNRIKKTIQEDLK
ncbi:Alpha-soluble NSF attachment protein [Amphibalanus amphitrite]|uniref:Alpha-soluble NSF attachment protein n=1 Tax=Amphibalanus amphitrite TaxID=1232801 RepID=A0A6A4VT94_AMPAM|nr:alpha-soluble NSF attachment protein-like isoform X1 [Amphibalanus amphitrite]KAF0299327.1 Alpha-soluble NSF attachment protein [Amphibalanus amphitrite]